MRLFGKKKKPAVKRPWWEGSKDWGVRLLCALFNVGPAGPHHPLKRRPTAKDHRHKHRRCGSKALKQYDRDLWNLMVKEGLI